MRRIVVEELKQPKEDGVESEVEWLCRSFGMLNNRDTDKTSVSIFEQLIRESRRNKPLSSDNLAERANISRATAIHHIRRFERSGIAIRTEEGFEMRAHTLQQMVEDIELDFQHILERIRKVAELVDDKARY